MRRSSVQTGSRAITLPVTRLSAVCRSLAKNVIGHQPCVDIYVIISNPIPPPTSSPISPSDCSVFTPGAHSALTYSIHLFSDSPPVPFHIFSVLSVFFFWEDDCAKAQARESCNCTGVAVETCFQLFRLPFCFLFLSVELHRETAGACESESGFRVSVTRSGNRSSLEVYRLVARAAPASAPAAVGGGFYFYYFFFFHPHTGSQSLLGSR